MGKGHELMNHGSGDRDAAFFQRMACLLADLALRRNGIEHHISRLTGDRGKIQRRADGIQVECGRSAWNQDQIGGTSRRQRSGIGIRSTVDDDQIGRLCSRFSSRPGNRVA